MKIAKKYFLIAFTFVLAVTLTACNLKSTSNPETIFNKTIENTKKIKSGESSTTSIAEMVTDNSTPKSETKIVTTFTTEPAVYKISGTVSSDNVSDNNYKDDIYLKDDTAYVKKSTSSDWTKSSNPTVTSQYDYIKDNIFPQKVLEAYKNNAKDFKVTEENGNYVLTYSGTDNSKFKEIITAVLNSTRNADDQEDLYKDIDPKELQIKYVATKDFTPVRSETKFSFSANNLTFIGTINTDYSKINSINEVSLPDETKNAVEVTG